MTRRRANPMSEQEHERPGGPGEADAAVPPPSRAVVIAAGALALVMCAFWLSCHEVANTEPVPPDAAAPQNGPR